MSGWISVEYRLPEHDQEVLIFAEGKIDEFYGDTVITITRIVNQKIFHDSPDHWDWVSPWQYFFTDYEITHWMPLPKPPGRKGVPAWWLKKKIEEYRRVNKNDEADTLEFAIDDWEEYENEKA